MRPTLLLGDEAVARGAIDAGIAGAFAYPGTPATEIFEAIQAHARRDPASGVFAEWSANEKVAYEEALGMSYAGRRALVSMKHVGLNVAMDPFVNSALTGVNAGLVLAVADDPSMHSSQNEQDSRVLADFAKIPVFEPANQLEAYEMTREAFEYSERIGLPVMLRMVTRLCHSRATVEMPAREGSDPPVGAHSDPLPQRLDPRPDQRAPSLRTPPGAPVEADRRLRTVAVQHAPSRRRARRHRLGHRPQLRARGPRRGPGLPLTPPRRSLSGPDRHGPATR